MGFEHTRLALNRIAWGGLVLNAILIALAFAILAFAVLVASGHEAPSGWSYPGDCCGGKDCHPVPCDELTEDRKGIHWKNLTFERALVRSSGDGQCHVCHMWESINGGKVEPRTPLCVFLRTTS